MEADRMDISIDDRWAGFVQEAVSSGQFGSASEVVDFGLRLVQEQKAELLALKAAIREGMDESGDCTFAEVRADLDAIDDRMRHYVV